MSRTLTAYTNALVEEELNALLTRPAPELYRQHMHKLGEALGHALNTQLKKTSRVLLACSAEDADFLASGVLEALSSHLLTSPSFACFWNERQRIGTAKHSISPILRRYQEPVEHVDVIIMLKSIISGSCVVKTNLMNLLDQHLPARILIAAPVMHKDALSKLKAEFAEEIVQRFECVAFAIDSERDEQGVHPGIGGEIYQLLGFAGQADKNRFSPEIVKQRRQKLLAAH